MSDIVLEPNDSILIEGKVVRLTAHDVMLDSPARRSGSAGLRRALVHDVDDSLTINYASDYPNGVNVRGRLTVQEIEVEGTGVNVNGTLKAQQIHVNGTLDAQQIGIAALPLARVAGSPSNPRMVLGDDNLANGLEITGPGLMVHGKAQIVGELLVPDVRVRTTVELPVPSFPRHRPEVGGEILIPETTTVTVTLDWSLVQKIHELEQTIKALTERVELLEAGA